MPTVALTTGTDRRMAVLSALREVDPAVREKLRTAKRFLLKPNLVHDKNQLASTHADAVRATLDWIRTHSDAPIVVADASYHGTKAAFKNFGYEKIPKEYSGVELRDLNDDETVPATTVRRDGSTREVRVAKTVVYSDFRISLARMKMHIDTIATLAIKNWSVGIMVAPKRPHPLHGGTWARWPVLHAEGSRAHHESIADILRQFPMDLAVIDGWEAMEGEGPTHGTPVEMRLALAGTDPVAVDATAARIMDIDPQDIGHLVFAEELGLGTMSDNAIKIIGGVSIENVRHSLTRPSTYEHIIQAWRR